MKMVTSRICVLTLLEVLYVRTSHQLVLLCNIERVCRRKWRVMRSVWWNGIQFRGFQQLHVWGEVYWPLLKETPMKLMYTKLGCKKEHICFKDFSGIILLKWTMITVSCWSLWEIVSIGMYACDNNIFPLYCCFVTWENIITSQSWSWHSYNWSSIWALECPSTSSCRKESFAYNH